jgi:hypothetical protein
MQVTFPVHQWKPAYEVEFRPRGYHIDGVHVKRVTTILDKFPDSGEGLTNWSKQRVAITAARMLNDRVVEHPVTKKRVCYFPAELIAQIMDAAYRNPDDIKDETADVGTAVHEFCDEWLNAGATEEARQEICTKYLLPPNPQMLEILQAQTETKEMSDDDRNLFYDKMKSYMFNRFCMWWMKAKLTFVASEIAVGSKKYMFAGRLDILAKDDKGRLILIDFKTSKWVAPHMFSQVASYKLAFEEMYGQKIFKCAIVQCPREWSKQNQGFGIYNFKPTKYRAIFLNILRYWKETEFKAADCRKDCLA